MKDKGRSYNSIRNIVLGFGSQIAIMIFAFATRTIFVRLLGAEYTGVSGLFSNILTLLSLTELGVGQVLTYRLYKPIKENDELLICRYLNFFRKIYLGIAIAVAVIGSAVIPFLPAIIGECSLPMSEIRIYYVLYLINSVASYLVVDKITLLQADQKVFIRNVTHAVSSIAMHMVMIVYLLICRNFVGYLLIQVGFTMAQNIFLNFLVKKMYPYINKSTEVISSEQKLDIVKNVKDIFLYKVSGVIINYTDNILISIILGIAVVGMYSNYYLIITYLNTFIGYVTTGIAASLGNFNVQQDAKKSYAMFKNLLYLFSLITVFCVACYMSIIQGFIGIWIGEKFMLDYSFVISIMITFYIVHIISPVWMYRESMGMFSQIKYVLLVTAALNVILSFILGKLIGLAGIIIATGLSRLLTEVWYEPRILFREKFGEKPVEYLKLQLKQLLLNVAIISASVGICSFIPDGFIYLIVKGIICVLTIAIFEFVFMRKTDEFEWVKGKLLGVFRKFARR